jgi:putative transcriptional regulator
MHNHVRRLRAARHLSQGALATALGVSRQTINAIETGRYLPSLPLAINLARYFGTTVEDLFHPEPGEIVGSSPRSRCPSTSAGGAASRSRP